jgi:hypothetical protein
MIFELENAAEATVRISGAFIDVAESVSDPDPAIQLVVEDPFRFDRCDLRPLLNSLSFRLENYGWTSAESAEIGFSFDSDGGQPGDSIIKEIGTIQDSVTVDLGPDLARQRVEVDDLSEGEVPCPTTSAMADTGERDEASAAACIASEGQLFGKLAELVSVHGDQIGVTASGTLRYHWTDAAGQSHPKTSPFKQWIRLGRLANTAGCFGEMGAPDDIVGTSRKSFSFLLDKQNYRVGIPLTDDVPAGVTGRWRITLDAPQTSHHTFRIVLELADGRRVASRPIELLYFVPSR